MDKEAINMQNEVLERIVGKITLKQDPQERRKIIFNHFLEVYNTTKGKAILKKLKGIDYVSISDSQLITNVSLLNKSSIVTLDNLPNLFRLGSLSKLTMIRLFSLPKLDNLTGIEGIPIVHLFRLPLVYDLKPLKKSKVIIINDLPLVNDLKPLRNGIQTLSCHISWSLTNGPPTIMKIRAGYVKMITKIGITYTQ